MLGKRLIYLLLLVPVLLVLGACSDFDEMKAHRELNEARAVLEEGDELLAEQVLADLVRRYPQTQAARQGEEQLLLLRKQRERRERSIYAKVLESYQQVLDGYRSLYAVYPDSADELDQSGYFFDTDYLADITGEGFRTYLWFTDDEHGYRVWSVREGLQQGYTIDGLNRRLSPVSRDRVESLTEQEFRVVAQKGRLTIIGKQ